MYNRVKLFSRLSRSGWTVATLVGVLFGGALLAQASTETDEPLRPLVVGGTGASSNTVASGEARTATIAGMEVHSLPPGKSLVLRFENMDDLSGFEALYVKMEGEDYRRVPEQEVRLTGDGIYRLTYYGVDRAGNKNTPATRQLMIDSTAPVVRGNVVNSKVTRSGAVGAQAKLSLTAQDSGTGVKSIQWRAGREGQWQEYSTPIALAELSGEGQRVIEYKAIDRIDNETISSIFSYTIDTSAPVIPAILAEPAEGEGPILLTRAKKDRVWNTNLTTAATRR